MRQLSECSTHLTLPVPKPVGAPSADGIAGRLIFDPVRAAGRLWTRYRSVLILAALLSGFAGLQFLLPLGLAIKIGADEDYELSKATLYNHGYRLYTEIWNDQPPLITHVIAGLQKHVSQSVLAPRLFTVGFATILLAATFTLILRVSGLLAASIATAMLIGSPGFLELSSSAMQEIPALAPIVVALCLLLLGPRTRWCFTEIFAGVVFGFALQMKLIGAAYLPLAALILWLRGEQASVAGATPPSRVSWTRCRRWVSKGVIFGISVLLTFIVLNYLTGNSLVVQLQQSWAAHFAAAKSYDYGSPEDYGYQWSVLVKNWDTTAPALVGACVLLSRVRGPWQVLPIAWLAVSFLVFGTHKPWWAYYYVHNALPLCWCAGVGVAFLWERYRAESLRCAQGKPHPAAERKRLSNRIGEGRPSRPGPGSWLPLATISLFALSASAWMGSRIYLEEQAIRNAPKLYTCLVLKEVERFKPFTKFMFSDQPIFSFHADLPMPPHLAVLSLKRFWTGELTNAGLASELETLKPGLILLGKASQQVPYEDLLNREYKLVYQDSDSRLYAHESISKKAAF